MKGKRIHSGIMRGLIILSFFIFHFHPCQAQIGMRELGDSLTLWTGFSPVWSPAVRVKNLRVNGNNVSVRTNSVLRDVRWTPENIAQLKRKVSMWVLGHEKGQVTIQAVNTDIETLVTECARSAHNNKAPQECDLTDRNIALYPSHGLYYNRDRDEWIWQRATLWTTVEDLYSQEYVKLIRKMLENAGADIYMPRAGLDQQDLGVSGMPQWTEGARYWVMAHGADSSIWNLYEGDEYKDDMKCRAMWVNSLEVPIDLCLAFHTDGQDSGNDSTIIGTLVIYTAKDDEGNMTLRNGKDREKINRNLADWIQTQITNDLRTIAPEWTRRQLKEANYCETRVPVVPSIILELLSHKNMADMKYGLDPKFRFTAARAVYKGILRYLNGPNAIVQPLPVQEIGVQITRNEVNRALAAENHQSQSTNAQLLWRPTLDQLEASAEPTYYMVYIQANDGEWNIQQVEKTTQLQLELQPGVRYNYYVVAGNDGGLSLPSPIVSAYLTPVTDNPSPVTALIVDGFDDVYGPEWFADSTFAGIVPGSYACENEFSCAYIGQQWDYNRSHPWINDDNCGFGACYRDHAGQLTIGNTHDWCARHGYALRKMRISYVSCTEGMLPSYTLHPTPYTVIDFVCGRQRQPLREQSRLLIADYLNIGGKLLLSTDHFSAIDPIWAKRYLHASYFAAHATRSGRISSPRHRLYQLVMEPNEEQLFTCTPEGLKTTDTTAVRMATYEDMRCAAAVGFKSQMPTATLVYGFPLEAVQDFEKIYKHAIEWLLSNEEKELTRF